MKKHQTQSSLYRSLSSLLRGALLLAFVFAIGSGMNRAAAQSSPADGWTPPVNLSNSGSASNPLLLVDANNIPHVIWYDAFAGYRYARADSGPEAAGGWTAPVNITLPFGDNYPRLVMGPNNLVYAFWIDTATGRNILSSSRVLSQNFGNGNAWEPRRLIVNNALAFDVAVDADGVLHLVYLTMTDTPTQPAGVYYRQAAPGGGWTIDKQIYTSLYFRGMGPEEAYVSVDSTAADPASGQRAVFVTWDTPAMQKAFVSRSIDSGETWEAALDVDPATDTSGTGKRYHLEVNTWNDQVILVWKKQLSETSCDILYQVSKGGQEWSAPARVLPEASGCPAVSGFVAQRDDYLVWRAEINTQVLMAAWDGSQWSLPQIQADLAAIKDPATGRAVTMGCRTLFYHAPASALYAAGCDLDTNQDIWLTSKVFGDLASWFPPPSSWGRPVDVGEAQARLENLNLLSDSAGNFYALWTQPAFSATGQTTQNQNSVVHYSSLSDGAWMEPSAILQQRGGSPNDLSAWMSANDDLLVAWRGPQNCQIFFSRAPAARGFSRVEWLEPVALPAPPGACGSPAVAEGPDGTFYVAYPVAINEGRGLYLNRSLDGGRTWDEPFQVFDAQAERWEMVSSPVITVSGSRLHLLWRHGSLHNADESIGLGYAYSDDGLNWSPAETIESTLVWADLAAVKGAPEAGAPAQLPEGALMRVWQQQGTEQPVIRTQTSTDGGASWTPAISITSFGEILGRPALRTDANGGVHLVQMSRDYLGATVLRHWVWYNDNWAAVESLDLGLEVGPILDLSGAISTQKQLAIIYAQGSLPGAEDNFLRLAAVTGDAEAAGVTPETLPAAVETPQADPTQPAVEETALAAGETASPIAQPTAAIEETSPPVEEPQAGITPTASLPAFPAGQEGPQEPAESNTWMGLALGVALAVIIIVGVFGYRIAQSRA